MSYYIASNIVHSNNDIADHSSTGSSPTPLFSQTIKRPSNTTETIDFYLPSSTQWPSPTYEYFTADSVTTKTVRGRLKLVDASTGKKPNRDALTNDIAKRDYDMVYTYNAFVEINIRYLWKMSGGKLRCRVELGWNIKRTLGDNTTVTCAILNNDDDPTSSENLAQFLKDTPFSYSFIKYTGVNAAEKVKSTWLTQIDKTTSDDSMTDMLKQLDAQFFRASRYKNSSNKYSRGYRLLPGEYRSDINNNPDAAYVPENLSSQEDDNTTQQKGAMPLIINTNECRGGLKIASELSQDLSYYRAAHTRYNYSKLYISDDNNDNRRIIADYVGLIDLFGSRGATIDTLPAQDDGDNQNCLKMFQNLDSTQRKLNFVFYSKSTENNDRLLPRFSMNFETIVYGLKYSVEIPEFQIPRPSKYDDNVIFNKYGFEEFVNQIHEYPTNFFDVTTSLKDAKDDIPNGQVPFKIHNKWYGTRVPGFDSSNRLKLSAGGLGASFNSDNIVTTTYNYIQNNLINGTSETYEYDANSPSDYTKLTLIRYNKNSDGTIDTNTKKYYYYTISYIPLRGWYSENADYKNWTDVHDFCYNSNNEYKNNIYSINDSNEYTLVETPTETNFRKNLYYIEYKNLGFSNRPILFKSYTNNSNNLSGKEYIMTWNGNIPYIPPYAIIRRSSTYNQLWYTSTAEGIFCASGDNEAASFRLLKASDIPELSASKITNGVLSVDRIPNLDASKITSGTLLITRGGTGLTASPSMLINLGSTTAANVFTASPEPGVKGKLAMANGGTGTTFKTGEANTAETNIEYDDNKNAIIRRSGSNANELWFTKVTKGAFFATAAKAEATFGTLPTSCGGTGTDTAPTQGGVIYASSNAKYASTAAGTSGQFLKSNGNGAPTWANVDAFPSQTNNAGKFLTTNGTTVSWANVEQTDEKVKANTNTNNYYRSILLASNQLSAASTSTSSITTAFNPLIRDNVCVNTSTGALYAIKVFNAVFNDYAEYRTTIDVTPGHVVVDNDDGSLTLSTTRLQPGAQVISDTYGHCMGETDTAKTPLAVAGRVLVYPYLSRGRFHAGMAVCSAPDGTVDIMTREEIRNYPDCIVGIVSEIPDYEEWGSDNVKVDGRIWIKVK